MKTENGRVIVLGASGFVGKHLIGELSGRGASSVGVSSKGLDLLSLEAKDKLHGLLSEQDVAADTLVFISALTPDKGRDLTTLRKNLQMLEPLLAVLKELSPGRLVYVSSDAVYSDAEQSLVRESSPAAPGSFHGVMHLTRELALREAAGSRIPLHILRLPPLFGPGDTHNSYGPNRFARTLQSDGKIKLFGAGEEKRDHLYIGDAVRMIADLIALPAVGVTNVVSGRSHSFMEIAAELVEVAKARGAVGQHEEPVECLPRQSAITHRHYDITRLAELLPDVRFTPLADSLAALF